MRATAPLVVCFTILLAAGTRTSREQLPTAVPNDNTAAAGTLSAGVLTLALEARHAVWHPDGDSLPGIAIPVFAEEGKPALVPGPLVRVRSGTEIRLSVRNSLGTDTLTFHFPSLAGRGGGDSVVVAPGASADLRVRADTPGNYLYRARMNDWLSRGLLIGGLMTGAIVVDSPSVTRPHDRVLMLLTWADSVTSGGIPVGRVVFAINGRSWPHTERLHATVGDTVRWRVINAASEVHPMHLHGFYFRVDDLSGRLVERDGQGHAGRMVVTERMPAYSAMSVTWVPERAGNWLFHCHFQIHVVPHASLDSAAPRMSGPARAAARRAARAAVDHGAHENHSLTGMGGLVMGIIVKPRPGERVEGPAAVGRRLRLVAAQDAEFPDSAPSLRFRLEEGSTRQTADVGPGFSPTIHLTRGEPVSIMVVNRLSEPTAIHWHGIELDSYYDGVAGFGGFGRRVSPIIAPRDSFEARFTPPRAGTFMYHSHIDEPRQQRAGLVGALIVRDPGASTTDDHVFFLKSARAGPTSVPVLDINGHSNPDTVVLGVGRPARLRFISLALLNPNATVTLTSRQDSSLRNLRDTLIVQWRPVAKDGADLPEHARAPRLARQIIGMGETYDYEYVPATAGVMEIEVRGAGPQGRLLARVPVRVQ